MAGPISASSSIVGSNHHNKRVLLRRPDGRPLQGNTLRPLACELSTLQTGADGSALWKAGSTHVLAAVYGPIAPLMLHMEDANKGIVSVIIKNDPQGQQSSSSGTTAATTWAAQTVVEYGQFLHDTLTACIDNSQFPRCVIEIVLQVIQADGSLLACLLHASVAALMDAGIDLLYLPVATTCLVVLSPQPSAAAAAVAEDVSMDGHDDDPTTTTTTTTTKTKSSKILLDPTSAEEFGESADNASSSCSIVVLVNQPKQPDAILGCSSSGGGLLPLNDLLACVQVASKACHAIPAFFRLAMEQKVTRESQTLWSR